MIPEWVAWFLCAAFTGLFAGYVVGRRIGRREGIREGLATGPLEVRRRSWEEGICLICGTPAGGGVAASAVATEADATGTPRRAPGNECGLGTD